MDLTTPATRQAAEHEISYIGARMREPSTYTGLAIVMGLFGAHFAPDLGKALIDVGVAVGALIGVLLPEGGAKGAAVK